MFHLPPLHRGLAGEVLSVVRADTCMYGSEERNPVGIRGLTESLSHFQSSLLTCTGSHRHGDPDDWERAPEKRNILPGRLVSVLLSSLASSHNKTEPVAYVLL